MKNPLAGALALAAAVSAAPAQAQALQSSEEWQYRAEPERCRAFRWFGTGEDRVLLQLASFGPGSAIEAMVVSPRLPDEPASVREVELGWNGAGLVGTQAGLLGAANRTPSLVLLFSHRPVTAFGFLDERTKMTSPLDPASDSVALRPVGGTPIELRTGSLVVPLQQLAECEAGLMERWGWPRDYSLRVATPPRPLEPQSWFYRAVTYPATELLQRVSSILQIRLRIDPNGRVTDCVVQSSPGSSRFGDKNCERIVRMGRFTPGLDPAGNPVESFAQMSITFAQWD